MEGSVNFYESRSGNRPVQEWLDTLDVKTRAKVLRNVSLLEKFGLNLHEPYIKPLEDKLYEVRTKDSKGIYRIIYFAHTGKTFVLLHGFVKKTQKTPRREIELAKERMMEVINR